MTKMTRTGMTDEQIRRFGSNSNSFMTLYPGFRYHAEAGHGLIAYVETPQAWVGGAEPYCAPEDRISLMNSFAEAAARAGKKAFLMPVGLELASAASQGGFGTLMIGSEPRFDLTRYPKTGRTWVDVVPTAKTLRDKGARVTQVNPLQLDAGTKAALDSIVQEWLGTRKSSALGFLNQVAPWYRQEEKKYFIVQYSGNIVAFLAAVPVWARNCWYLVDLFRRKNSPVGSTELLLLESMRILREEGAKEATLGVSPLSGLSDPAGASEPHPLLYPLLKSVYEKGGFYNFKSLFQFKMKFDPTSVEPVFLIYRDARRNHKQRLSVRDSIELSRAFFPDGVLKAALTSVIRAMRCFSLSDWIKARLKPGTVVRSAPATWPRLVARCKLTVALAIANVSTFLLTADGYGKLRSSLEKEWGYSWAGFLENPLHALLLSPFLHWSWLHLTMNLISMVLFTGLLEYLSGTVIAGICYLVPMLVANPLTSVVLVHAPDLGLPQWSHIKTDFDVGASLGIFGTAGALSHFLNRGRILTGILILVSAIGVWVLGSWVPLNHLTALLLGWLLGWAILQR